MAGDAESLLEAGQSALAAGDWQAARSALELALERERTPEALAALADTLIWLGDSEQAVRLYEEAHALFRRAGDPAGAALATVSLYLIHRISLGNVVVSRGWLYRAMRLAEENDLGPLSGWVVLLRAHDCGDPDQAEALAREGLELARELKDSDRELCALSQTGVALVEGGRIEQGVALLDEAMAASLAGEGERHDTIVWTSCNMITCCSRAAQFERAAEWVRVADGFTERYGSPHLYTLCRLHLGNVLFSTGRWSEAEAELGRALEMARRGEPALRDQALAKLAELRLAQGRPDEAERLVAGIEERPFSVYVLAALRFERGESGAALSLLRRTLGELGEETLESGALLELLSAAWIAEETPHSGLSTARTLVWLGERLESEAVAARGQLALGRAEAAMGEAEVALSHTERALHAFTRLGMPLEAGRARLLLAEMLATEESEAAVTEARAALACFEKLGAARHADEAAAFLRERGARAGRSGSRGLGLLTARELEVLELLGEGLPNKEIAARLFISPKTVEHHVGAVLSKLELRGRSEAAAYAVRQIGATPP